MGGNVLLLIAQIAGFVLLAGVLALAWKGRVYLDAETKNPIEFEFPILGKVKTQSPILLLVVIGAAMVLYPIGKSDPSEVTLTTPIQTTGKAVTVRVIPLPAYQLTVDSSNTYEMRVPVLPNVSTYYAQYEVDKQVLPCSEPIVISGSQVKLNGCGWVDPSDPVTPQLPATKEVSDAFLKQLGIDK
jgi:hypothetical protein